MCRHKKLNLLAWDVLTSLLSVAWTTAMPTVGTGSVIGILPVQKVWICVKCQWTTTGISGRDAQHTSNMRQQVCHPWCASIAVMRKAMSNSVCSNNKECIRYVAEGKATGACKKWEFWWFHAGILRLSIVPTTSVGTTHLNSCKLVHVFFLPFLTYTSVFSLICSVLFFGILLLFVALTTWLHIRKLLADLDKADLLIEEQLRKWRRKKTKWLLEIVLSAQIRA